jgi:hypothetical protein
MKHSTFLIAGMLLASCDTRPVVERKLGKPEGEPKQTAVLRAADLAGYDGTKLKKSVDGLIDANKKRNQSLERASQAR